MPQDGQDDTTGWPPAGRGDEKPRFPVEAAGPSKGGDFRLVQIQVQDNNVEKAIRALKRKLTKEGIFRQLKEKRWHEKTIRSA